MFLKVDTKKGIIATLQMIADNEEKDNVFTLPGNIGAGTITTFKLGPFLQMMLQQYELNDDLVMQRPAEIAEKKLITFSFRHVLHKHGKGQTFESGMVPCVQVSSGNINLETFTPANKPVNVILIRSHVDLLKDFFNGREESKLLKNIISGQQAYLYDELISSEMQIVATQIFEANTVWELSDFYLKLKAQELIYLFFRDLLKRETITSYPMNALDVKMMYLIREKLASNLSVTPNVNELKVLSHMSDSKMRRLFKQIFGSSIYNYHQTLRLNEAARLLKLGKISVSEVGYQMGFTNLSHFSRIFERHTGLKPKKYSGNSNH